MPVRLTVPKTYKLFIAGQFPRSESGRSLELTGGSGETIAHISRASRKDLRNAVEAARAAAAKWATATAYNRGQIMYRMAEMLEGRQAEFTASLMALKHRGGLTKSAAKREVETAIDRLVCFGGWADKYAQVLGCNNPVAGPYYNFTVPEPAGVVGVIAPDEPSLLGLISLIAPPMCAGNTVVALASERNPLPGALLGEISATSDVPPGVLNVLTGQRVELVPHFASHRDINGIHAAGVSAEHARVLREGVAENLKRVTIRGKEPAGKAAQRASKPARFRDEWSGDDCHNPWWIEPFVEFKTVWHPSGA